MIIGTKSENDRIEIVCQKDKKCDDGELTAENGVLKIKLTNEEFLSGLRKGDKLIPIITAVVFLGDEPWDGPGTYLITAFTKNDKDNLTQDEKNVLKKLVKALKQEAAANRRQI